MEDDSVLRRRLTMWFLGFEKKIVDSDNGDAGDIRVVQKTLFWKMKKRKPISHCTTYSWSEYEISGHSDEF